MAISTINQNGLNAPLTLTSPVINTVTSASGSALTLQSNGGTTAITVDTSQNVGIGVSSMTVKQQVYQSSSTLPVSWLYRGPQQATTLPTTFGYPYLQIGNTEYAANGTGQAIQTIGFGYTGGNSGSNPPAEIGLCTTSTAGYTTGDLVFATRAGTSGAATERVRMDSSGYLLVGTTINSASSGPGVKLYPGGSVYIVNAGTDAIDFWNTVAGNWRFYVDSAGKIYSTSTSITAISDATLKTNIKDLETGLNEVMQLKPRRFDWIDGEGENIAGFVAQEVETVLPDLVVESKYSVDENGETINKKHLKMGDMVPTLVKAIQELKAEFDEYKRTHP